MLTPAEEIGLSGMNLAARVRQAFFTLDQSTLARLLERVREESTRRHVVYMREGASETIRLLPCPVTAMPDQMSSTTPKGQAPERNP